MEMDPAMSTSRLTVVNPQAYDEAQRRAHDRIAAGPRAGVRGPLALWLHSPDFAERAQQLGEFLRFGTSFEARLSELAILVVAREWQCAYVWLVHEPIARRAGVGAAFVDALALDADAVPDDADERAIALFCRQLLRHGSVDDAVRTEVIERHGERGCVELTGITGYYTMGAFTLACANLPMPGGEPPPFSGPRGAAGTP